MEIGKIYCINLPEDMERRKQAEEEFNKLGLQNIRWTAATRPPQNYKASNYSYPGEFGCTLSHMKAMVDSIGDSKCSLIVEDDVVFSLDTLDRIYSIDPPPNWSVIYLGGNPKAKLVHYTDDLCRVSKFNQTTAYIINPHRTKDIVKFFTDNISKKYPYACADNLLNEFTLLDSSGYCMYPPVVHQREGYSTLRGDYRDYSDRVKKHWGIYKPC